MSNQTTESMFKRAKTILLYGDSWTYGNTHGLKYALQKYGNNFRLISEDHWGSEAKYFASNPHLLPEAVKRHKADYVLLSLGGNDFKNILWKKDRRFTAPWTTLANIRKDLEIVLDQLYKEQPNVKVVMYGYDFLGNLEDTIPFHRLSPNYGKYLSWVYKSFGIRLINYYTMKLGSMLDDISKQEQKRGYPMTYVPLWGTLQAAAQKKDQPIEALDNVSYNLGASSPSIFMHDTIHANSRGYELLMTRLYHKYFSKEQ
jgi:lysophospholipase L1-like esterase